LPALVTGVAGAVQREVPQRRELRLSSSASSRQAIRRDSFRSVRELTDAIGAFLDACNDHGVKLRCC
jgi:hypothetical protein